MSQPSRLKGETFERSKKGNLSVLAGLPEFPMFGRRRTAQVS